MIPEGWQEATAEELCGRISVGIVIKPTQYYVNEGRGIRAFRSANIGEGFVRDSDWIYISEEGHEKNKKSALKENDILIVRTGYPGTACLLPERYEGSNCIDIIFARPDPDQVVPSYLCTFTNSEYGKKQVLDGSGGLAQQHFNVGAFKRLKLPLPPLPEQRKIAGILRTWDRAIETVEALIANARAQKQALMQQLLPQGTTPPRKRLPGFSGEWREIRLGDLVEEVSRDVDWDDDATYKLISVRRRSEGIFHRESLSGHEILTKSMKVARAGDFLVSKMQIVHGASALVKQPFDGFSISGSYIALIPKDHAKLDIEFFDWYSRTPYFYKLTYISSYGVHIEKMTFNLKSFLKKTILVPSSKAEQSAIVVQLNSAEALIGEHQQQAAALRREKAALMQQLLTGKRRVKLDDDEVAA